MKSFLVKIGNFFVPYLYLLAWRIVNLIPDNFAVKFFNYLGYRLAQNQAKTRYLRKNLSRVLQIPPAAVPQEIIIKAMQSYTRYWREVFCLPKYSQTDLFLQLNLHGVEILESALAAQQGVILVLPHSGNWDMAGLFLTLNYGSFTTVAERLKPEILYKKFVQYRESLGFEILPLTGSKPPYEILKQRLQAGKIVCLLGERDLTTTGIPVNFMGAIANMPAGPAKLAADTGAKLIPVHCWIENNSNHIAAYPEIKIENDIAATTQRLADVFSANITAHPTDWHMLQPFWADDVTKIKRKTKNIK